MNTTHNKQAAMKRRNPKTAGMKAAMAGLVGLVLACLVAVPSAQADLLAYEPFDYPAGQLHGQGSTGDTNNSDFGFTGDWDNGRITYNVTNNSLVPPNGYPTTTGNHATVQALFSEIATRQLDLSAFPDHTGGSGDIGEDTSGALWMSILLCQTGTVFLGADYFEIHLMKGATTRAAFGLFQGADGATSAAEAHYSTIISNSIPANLDTGDILRDTTNTVLLVLKMTFSTEAGQDRIDLWVNPGKRVPTTEDATHTDSDTGDLQFDSLQFRIRNKNLPEKLSDFDEIRLGETYGDVGKPQPPKGTVIVVQ